MAFGGKRPAALARLLVLHVFTRIPGDSHTLWDRWDNLRYYAGAIDLHLFPMLALLALPWARHRFSVLRRPALYLVVGLAVLCLAPQHFFRYLVVFIPLFCLVTAEILGAICDRSRAAAFGLGALLLLSHVPSVSFLVGRVGFWKTDLPDFFHEVTHPLSEPLKAAG